MRVKSLIKALEEILRSYKKEIESSPSVYIATNLYYDEENGVYRRQVIIDYSLNITNKENKKNTLSLYT